MTQTQDYLALLACLDREDDSALPALADWMEENGHPHAAGMRRVADGKCKPRRGDKDSYLDSCWVWDRMGSVRFEDHECSTPVPGAAFDRLRDAADVYEEKNWEDRLGFRVRSAAFLALAEALS